MGRGHYAVGVGETPCPDSAAPSGAALFRVWALLAGHSVAIPVQFRAISGLAPVQRSGTSGTGFGAAGVVGAGGGRGGGRWPNRRGGPRGGGRCRGGDGGWLRWLRRLSEGQAVLNGAGVGGWFLGGGAACGGNEYGYGYSPVSAHRASVAGGGRRCSVVQRLHHLAEPLGCRPRVPRCRLWPRVAGELHGPSQVAGGVVGRGQGGVPADVGGDRA